MQDVLRQRVLQWAGALVLAFPFVVVSGLEASAQSARIQQSERILQPAGDTVEHDSFGTSVAISGNTMVIGGFNADGVQPGAGAVFVFDKVGDNWVQTARLFADDGRAEPSPFLPGLFRSDSFGSTVAISGDTVIVGAPQHNHTGRISNAGAVYVFQRVNGAWSQQAELLSPFPNSQDQFGAGGGFGGIGISGNTIAVTDQGNGFRLPGAIDVFTKSNGAWSLLTQLQVPDDDFFLPSAVAIDHDTIVAGSSFSDAPNAFVAGVAYVFKVIDGQWTGPTATLAASDATTGAQFGSSVSLSGGLLAVGAITAPGATFAPGAAYVFGDDDGTWTQNAKLLADDGIDFDDFGFAVAVSGQTIVVGSNRHTPASTGVPFAGAAYVYHRRDGGWAQIAQLGASDGIANGDYGTAVAVLDNTLLIGADLQHPPVEGYPGGEAYLYRLNPR